MTIRNIFHFIKVKVKEMNYLHLCLFFTNFIQIYLQLFTYNFCNKFCKISYSEKFYHTLVITLKPEIMDAAINTRIKTVMEATQLTPADFAAAIGISRSNLTHLLSGRNQPSFSLLEKLLKAFPQVRTEWLVTGLGDMLRDDEDFAQTVSAISNDNPLPHTQFEMDFEAEEPENAPVPPTPSKSAENPNNNKDSQPVLVANIPSKTRLQRGSQRQPLKKVQKIVYFYTDNTFDEYYPR